MAVCPTCRRRGIATAMIARLKGKLELYNRPRIVAEVRETNLPAQLFFREQGFHCDRVVTGRDAIDGTDEDAYIFTFTGQFLAEGGE